MAHGMAPRTHELVAKGISRPEAMANAAQATSASEIGNQAYNQDIRCPACGGPILRYTATQLETDGRGGAVRHLAQWWECNAIVTGCGWFSDPEHVDAGDVDSYAGTERP
jgi:hypothetical protein